MDIFNPNYRRTALIEARSIAKVVGGLGELLIGGRTTASAMAAHWGKKNPNGLALMFEDKQYTWGQLNARINQFAHWFRQQGIRNGDIVAIVMDNRPEYCMVVTALNRINARGALINTNLSGVALEHAVNIAKPKKILADSNHMEKVHDVYKNLETLQPADFAVWLEDGVAKPSYGRVINAEIEAAGKTMPTALEKASIDDHMCYIYTSGTTGLPKAAVVTNRRMLMAAAAFGKVMIDGSPDDVVYVPLPLYHSSGMYIGWGSCLVTGAAMAIRRKFSASNFVPDLHKFGATAFLYIGELCRYLLHTPEQPGEKTHRVRVCVGNGLRPDIWSEFQQRFKIPEIHEFYGATEGTAAIMNVEGRAGMIGRQRQGQIIVKCDLATGEPIRNSKGLCEEIGVGQTGLLLGEISRVMKFDGYLDQDATNKKIMKNVLKRGDQYFNTGDLVVLHDNKWLAFGDRVGDTFRWKGENVSTNEVAEIINKAAGVLESNVYGVQVPHCDGRAGMAALNVNDSFDIAQLAEFVKKNLANYQKPYFVRILDQGAMRITGTFKHQKVDYRNEGFNPAKVSDKLYFFKGNHTDGHYVPIDGELYAQIEAGEISPE